MSNPYKPKDNAPASRKPILVLGAIAAGLLAAVILGWRAALKQEKDPNDWKSVDKRK